MSAATPRRDNGLHAETYERLTDVESRLVDGLLERLRDAEVAAYSTPSAGRRGPYGDVTPPASPTDSVWVDSARRAAARETVAAYLAEVAEQAATESAWASLVARFDEVATDPVPRWPTSEDLDRARESDGAQAGGGTPGAAPTYASEGQRVEGRRAEDVEGHFVPPPPPPLPRVDTVSRFAWAGALGGPTVLLLATLTGIPLAEWVGGLAVAAFMAGFVTLVARMKDGPPTDSGPDDGAVV